jgi:NADH-quinone oxidoreductase subunit E
LIAGEGGLSLQEQVERILSEVGAPGGNRTQRMGAVLPVLQRVQREFGYIPEEVLPQVARALSVPESHIYGVATFYSQFTLSPPGKHPITVCCGTACHVRGSAALLNELSRKLGIKAGESTPDRKFSLETIACFGSCALAPVAVIDGKVQGRMNRSRLLKRVEELAAQDDEPSDPAAEPRS